MTLQGRQSIDLLRELIAALDGRVPRLERADEVGIARDAADLRRVALARIQELENLDGSHE